MTDPTFEQLTWERRDHVVRIGLNRAAKRNAFGLTMLRELGEAYTAYDEDDALRCGVLHAHGQHFTGGLDLAEVGPAVAESGHLFPPDHRLRADTAIGVSDQRRSTHRGFQKLPVTHLFPLG